jgi:hypothetical protein
MKKCLVLCLLLCTGCNWGKVTTSAQTQLWPVYSHIPAKPQLNIPASIAVGVNPDVDSLIKSLYDTTAYADTLLIMIEVHNTAAQAHNKQVESQLGIGDPVAAKAIPYGGANHDSDQPEYGEPGGSRHPRTQAKARVCQK